MIKASTAGTLEALLREAERVIGNNFRVDIIDYGVGAITEGDLLKAKQSGAVIFGFDVPCQPPIERGSVFDSCCIKLHKVIHRFIEDIGNLVYDA
jgi:translation initiation factor IF-2